MKNDQLIESTMKKDNQIKTIIAIESNLSLQKLLLTDRDHTIDTLMKEDQWKERRETQIQSKKIKAKTK